MSHQFDDDNVTIDQLIPRTKDRVTSIQRAIVLAMAACSTFEDAEPDLANAVWHSLSGANSECDALLKLDDALLASPAPDSDQREALAKDGAR